MRLIAFSMTVSVSRSSARELEALEAMQRLLDLFLVRPARALADPGPLLHQQLLPLAICLEIDRGDHRVADQHWLGKVAEAPFLLRDVCLEAVLVVEEEMQ